MDNKKRQEREGLKALPKNFEHQPPKNILIIKLSAIGDVVHSLPFLEALRSGFPGAHIDWVVEEDAL